MKLHLSHSNVTEIELENYRFIAEAAEKKLWSYDGPTGWLKPSELSEAKDTSRIKSVAEGIRALSEVHFVVGIGGSYLGAKAMMDAMLPYLTTRKVLFVGTSLSSQYLNEILELINEKNVTMSVISKSGTTTEPAVAFRLLRDAFYEKYGEEARKRIVVITDAQNSALKLMAEKEGYTIFEIPKNIGGRYSVFTSVGLLPMAIEQIDIDAFLRGVTDASKSFALADFKTNLPQRYAVLRTAMMSKGKEMEVLCTYEPKLSALSQWWMQLYGESDAKHGKGIFPIGLNFTSDLHSMGQLLQQGRRNLFETTLWTKDPGIKLHIPASKLEDGLGGLVGRTVSSINEAARAGTLEAHVEGGIPNIGIELEKIGEYELGEVIYFFMKSCALGGIMNGVNPFDQPGVESYKRNMQRLLKRK